MKKTAKTAGIILLLIVGGTLVSLRLLGYEPSDLRPGLWLTGDRVTEPVTDWSFTEQHQEIFVQTRTPYLIPHSVTTYCAFYEGDRYLFSGLLPGRRVSGRARLEPQRDARPTRAPEDR